MAEFQNLAQLLETMKLIDDAQKSVETAKEELENAELEDKTTATEKLNKHEGHLKELLDTEKKLRQAARTYLMTESKAATELTHEGISTIMETKDTDLTVPSITSRTPSFNFKLPKPDKFKRGQNFSKFCEKFMDYVTLSKIHDDNLYILFLNMVDDFTLDKLRKVPLSRDQMKDARKFIDLYEKKINPSHEGRTFRSKLADLKQKSGESIEDFAYRITDTASRAYSESEEALQEEACFSSFLKGLTDPDIKMKLHENTNIERFEEALDEAVRLESIKSTIRPQPRIEVTATDDIEILQINDDREEQGSERLNSRERQRNRNNRYEYQPTSTANPGYSSNNQRNGGSGFNQSQSNRRTTPPGPSSHGPNNNSQRGNHRQGAQMNQRRGNRNGPIICFNCNQPNHKAKDCLARLNY